MADEEAQREAWRVSSTEVPVPVEFMCTVFLVCVLFLDTFLFTNPALQTLGFQLRAHHIGTTD